MSTHELDTQRAATLCADRVAVEVLHDRQIAAVLRLDA